MECMQAFWVDINNGEMTEKSFGVYVDILSIRKGEGIWIERIAQQREK